MYNQKKEKKKIMQSFTEDPFLQRAFRDDKLFYEYTVIRKASLLLFLFCEWKHRMAEFTPFNHFFFIENKSIEYLQNLVNLEIKTVHIDLHWKWGFV